MTPREEAESLLQNHLKIGVVPRAGGESREPVMNYDSAVAILANVLSRKVNHRHGFEHLHSGEWECGIAYLTQTFSARGPANYAPCSKVMNHKGRCGRGDLTAF